MESRFYHMFFKNHKVEQKYRVGIAEYVVKLKQDLVRQYICELILK